MTDPLSVIASITALLGTGRQVVKGFEKVLKLKKAPDIILALQNEISDVCCVIEDIQSILERCGQKQFTPPASLNRAIEKTKATLLEVDCLIAYDLTVPDPKSANIRIDKSRWLHMETRIQELKNQMRVDKIDLSVGLNLLTSSFGVETLHQTRQLVIFGTEVDCQIRNTMASLTELSNISQTPSEHSRFASRPDLDSSRWPSDTEASSPESVNYDPESALVSRSEPAQEHAPLVLRMVSTPCCSLGCICKCHRPNVARTPRFLDHALGTLFFGYRAAPWFTQACDNPLCRTGTFQFTYTYAFPAWFLNRILRASLTYNHAQGPELILRVMRVRAANEPPFTFLNSLRIDPDYVYLNVRAAIENGEASVLDISTDGRTVLQFAVGLEVHDLVEYLLKKGADPFFGSGTTSSAYTVAWQRILSNQNSRTAARFSKLFDQSHLTSFGFSRLHRAYLGLSGDCFETVLESIDRTQIDSKDSNSRTTLSWAVERNDQHAVHELLACGADPNIVDNEGKTSLHWTWGSRNADCVRQLLKAKADVNMSPRLGITPLMTAVVTGNVEIAKLALEAGADINARSSLGLSALDVGVYANQYQAIIILLELRGSKLPTSAPPDVSLLANAAAYGDATTLEVLRRYGRCLRVESARSEEDMTAAFGAAHKRIASSIDHNEHFDLTMDRSHHLTDPAEWYKIFKQLAFEIHTASGGTRTLNEVVSERIAYCDRLCGSETPDDADLPDEQTDTLAFEDQGENEIEEEGNDQIGDKNGDDDESDRSKSDEEWRNAQEESISLPLSNLAV